MIAPDAGKLQPIWDSRRLWSLWEMMNLVIGAFYHLLRSMRSYIKHDEIIDKLKAVDLIAYKAERQRLYDGVQKTLTDLKEDCDNFGLIESGRCIARIITKLEHKDDIIIK